MLRVWRVAPHCKVVNLVRSGRKQPQRTEQVPGERLATPFLCSSDRPDTLLLAASNAHVRPCTLRVLTGSRRVSGRSDGKDGARRLLISSLHGRSNRADDLSASS